MKTARLEKNGLFLLLLLLVAHLALFVPLAAADMPKADQEVVPISTSESTKTSLTNTTLANSTLVNVTENNGSTSAPVNFSKKYDIKLRKEISDRFIKPGDLVTYLDRFTHHTIKHENIESASRAVEYFAKIFQFPFGILYDIVDRLIEFINYLEPRVPENIYEIPLSGDNKTLTYFVSLAAYVLQPPDQFPHETLGSFSSDNATTPSACPPSHGLAKTMSVDIMIIFRRWLEVCKLLTLNVLITRSWAIKMSILCALFVLGLVPFIYMRIYPASLDGIVSNPSIAPLQILAHILYNYFWVRIGLCFAVPAIFIFQLGVEHVPDFWYNWVNELFRLAEGIYQNSNEYDHFFIDERGKLQLDNIVSAGAFVGDIYLYYIAPIQFIIDVTKLVVYFVRAESRKMARLKYEFFNSLISSGFSRLIKFFVSRKLRLINFSKLIQGQSDLKNTTLVPTFNAWDVYVENSISVGLMYTGWYYSSPDSPIARTDKHCPHPELPNAVNMKISIVRIAWLAISTSVWSIPKLLLLLESTVDFLIATLSPSRGALYVVFMIMTWKPLVSWALRFSKTIWKLFRYVWMIPSKIIKLLLRIVFFNSLTFRYFIMMIVLSIIVAKLT